MKLIVTSKRPGELPYGIIYGLIAVAAVLAARYLPVLGLFPPCILRSATGVPCPTCGATRSLVSAARGDLAGALGINPLFTVILLGALFVLVLSAGLALHGKSIHLSTNRAQGTAVRIAVILLFLANWLYLALSL